MNMMNTNPCYVAPQSAESAVPADEVLCASASASVETMHENTIIYD